MNHLAYKHNFLDLDPAYKDKWGDPILRMTIDWTEHEMKQRQLASEVSTKITTVMARISGGKLIPTGEPSGMRQSRRYQTATYATTHLQGGAITGASKADSVVNRWLQHWDVPNLFVVGGSAFPQNSAAHPTVTAVALTLWSTDALISRYIKDPGPMV